MAPSEDGRTYTLRVTLDPAARIEYLIAYKNRFVRDPGNPRSVAAPAGPPRSELRMPAYRPPTALPPARVKGTIARIPFIGRSGVHRQIRVYVPSSANDVPHPILYAHDGDIMLDALGLPSILDSLIGAGRMAPVYVAFITAADRHDDYQPGSRFRSEFTAEMIPMLEGRYRVDANRRAVMGLSRSTRRRVRCVRERPGAVRELRVDGPGDSGAAVRRRARAANHEHACVHRDGNLRHPARHRRTRAPTGARAPRAVGAFCRIT